MFRRRWPAKLDLQDKERVSVQIMTERPVTFDNVVIRVSDQFRYKMHIDFDEANAAPGQWIYSRKNIKAVKEHRWIFNG